MNNPFIFIYKQLCKINTRISSARRNDEVLRLLAEANPSCRIFSPSLSATILGKYVVIHSGAWLKNVDISDFSYISHNSTINNVVIGKFCSIGSNVLIGLPTHPSKVFVSTYPAFYSNDNLSCPLAFRENKIFDDSIQVTSLANDVWIGSDVIIPGGIHIGTGAILAAGAVVVKDVPPYAVVGGNPAKVIRYRFSDEQIEVLLASEWWDWPIEKIRQHIDEFSDIEKFRETMKS